jgi:hypothetical protein
MIPSTSDMIYNLLILSADGVGRYTTDVSRFRPKSMLQ